MRIDFEYYTAVQREVNISVIKFDLHTDQKQKINFVLPYSMATLSLNMHNYVDKTILSLNPNLVHWIMYSPSQHAHVAECYM